MKKGDFIAAGAQPVAKGIDWILGTDIQNCGGCKTMQNNLNQGMGLADAVIARWFSSKQQQTGEEMKQSYVVTEQHVVMEADSPKDALSKHLAGESESVSMSAQVRPQRPTPAAPVAQQQPKG
jgi:hypothetical protein